MRRIGAVDIGGTKIAAGIVSEDGNVLYRSECRTDPEGGFDKAAIRIEQMLREGIEACGEIVGVGIGCPGPLDPLSGVIGDVGTLPGWEGSNLAGEVSRRLNVAVAVENDADAAALAEYAWGVQRRGSTFIYVTVSTGIGGAMIYRGELYRGAGNAHPEFGHQLIDPAGPLCYCGLCGCWESLASGSAMSAWFVENDPDGRQFTAAQIFDLARMGDPKARESVKREVRYLSLGLANLVTLFVPEVICLGGGVMQSSDLFLEETTRQVQRLCTQVPVQSTAIMPASLGRDIGLLGAAQCWLLRYR